MLKSGKHVFWEAFFVAVVIFLIGLFFGMYIENSRIQEIENYYSASEANLMDGLALIELSSNENFSCELLRKSSIKFADKIYNEALLLEKYENAEKLGEGMTALHKKYDLLRTFLWINDLKLNKKCFQKFNTLVYLYEYSPEDIDKIAENNVWSKILYDLKLKHQDDLVLIPIAVDLNISSLDLLKSEFELYSFPMIFINNKNKISNISSVEEIEKYLN